MILPFLSSFFSTVFLVLLFAALFRRCGWMDHPHLYGFKRPAVPYSLGIIFWIVFFFQSLFFLEFSPKLFAVLISGAVLTFVSFVDDYFPLPVFFRLGVHLLCAVIVVLAGVGIFSITNPFGEPFVLNAIQWVWETPFGVLTVEPLADGLAVLWIVFVINAMNWLDGSPGMVSGISTIACAILYLLATFHDFHVIDQSQLALMALILGGSALAFGFFDFPSPRVLMGDSGTMYLGLMIAVMALFSGGKLATAFIVLAFPMLDAVWTIVRRMVNWKSPFRGDFQHFHHELLRAGFSERQVNLFYFSLSFGFGLTALFLKAQGKLLAIALLFLLMVGIRLWLLFSSEERQSVR